MLKLLDKIDNGVEKLSSWLLVVSVILMLLLSVFSIVFRWVELSFLWIEPLVRHLVFLSAFLGGVLATGRGTHIGIDILGKYLESKDFKMARSFISVIINLASFCVLLWLIKASWMFTEVELEYGKEVFFGIHSGFLVGIIPAGLTLMVIRFFVRFVHSLIKVKKSRQGSGQ